MIVQVAHTFISFLDNTNLCFCTSLNSTHLCIDPHWRSSSGICHVFLHFNALILQLEGPLLVFISTSSFLLLLDSLMPLLLSLALACFFRCAFMAEIALFLNVFLHFFGGCVESLLQGLWPHLTLLSTSPFFSSIESFSHSFFLQCWSSTTTLGWILLCPKSFE